MALRLTTSIGRILNVSACVLWASIAHSQIVSTIAGTGTPGYSGDGGPATSAQVQVVNGLATDASGNVYIGDQLNRRLRKVSPSGIITTACGTGVAGFSGDGGPAAAATLGNIRSVATDAAGNTYLAIDGFYGERIRKISPSGIITTIAGTGTSGYSGDGGPATAAALHTPGGMAVDASGNIYFADIHNYRIRRISTAGVISTVAGNGAPGFSGDGGPATVASLFVVNDICLGPSGDIYFTDASDRIRRVSTSGIITTIAGSGTGGYSGDGGPATGANITVSTGICADAAGNIFFTDGSHRVRRISTSGIISTVAGTGTSGFSGDGCAATAAQVNGPWSIAVSSTGAVYFGDNNNHRVRSIMAGSVPTFTRGSMQTVEVCNTAATVMDTLLKVTDGDNGQSVSWAPLTLPAHGTLAATYTAVTTGGTISPLGTTYTPGAGYIGADTFSLLVTDCGGDRDTTTVCVTVIDPTISYPVSGADTICVGYTATLSVPPSTGTWSSSNTAVAAVSSLGIVTAIAAGTAAITYHADNACGATLSDRVITVIPASRCAIVSVPRETVLSTQLKVVQQEGRIMVHVAAGYDEELICTVRDMTGQVIARRICVTNQTVALPEAAGGCFAVSFVGIRTNLVRLICR